MRTSRVKFTNEIEGTTLALIDVSQLIDVNSNFNAEDFFIKFKNCKSTNVGHVKAFKNGFDLYHNNIVTQFYFNKGDKVYKFDKYYYVVEVQCKTYIKYILLKIIR